MKTFQSAENKIGGGGRTYHQSIVDRLHEAEPHSHGHGMRKQSVLDRLHEAEPHSRGRGMRKQTQADRLREHYGAEHKPYHHLKKPGAKYSQSIDDRYHESEGALGSGRRYKRKPKYSQDQADELREHYGAEHKPYHHLKKPGQKYHQSVRSRQHESEGFEGMGMEGDGKAGGFAFLPFLIPLIGAIAAPIIGTAARMGMDAIMKNKGKGQMFAPGAAGYGRKKKSIHY